MMSAAKVQTIESLDLALDKVFSDFYVVPSYQREYIWEDAQVEQLLEDIHDTFSDNGQTSEYFIGSIVVCPGGNGTLELIDGQQRMTTAYLFLCAVRDHLQTTRAPSIEALPSLIAAQDIDDDGRDVYRYRMQLQYEDSRGVLEVLAQDSIESQHNSERTRSVANILAAYKTIGDFLASHFPDDPQGVRRFYAYFTKRVKLVRIKTHSVAHALKVFETINDRGVGLDAMDLLKNLLFMNAEQRDYERLRDRWKQLVDTLYSQREKPLRFLRYYIFANYNVDRLREEEIYTWFSRHADECGYAADPFGFADTLVKSAQAYTRFVAGQNTDGSPNRYLRDIGYMSRAARQHLIILLAATHLKKADFTELCRQLENLFFAYVITRENTREFERSFARWAPELRQITSRDELDSFVAQRILPAREELAQRFDLAFESLSVDSVPQYRMRYILGKLTQFIDEKAYGEGASDLADYVSSGIHVEHILPRTPTQPVLDEFDQPDRIDEYIPMLGNLCLVESSINCAVGNQTFADKREAYQATKFLLTKSIAHKIHVGYRTLIDQAVEGLETFTEWTSESIQRRQFSLAHLSRLVWDMPTADAVR